MITLFCIVLLCACQLSAQTQILPFSQGHPGLAHFFNHPGLSDEQTENSSIILHALYCNPYGISDIRHLESSLSVLIDDKISIKTYYSKTSLHSLYSHHSGSIKGEYRLIDKLAFGIETSANYYHYTSKEYISNSLSGGILFKPFHSLSAEAIGRDLLSRDPYKTSRPLQEYSLGFIQKDLISLYCTLAEQRNYNWKKAISIRFYIHKYFELFTSISSNPYVWSLGFSISLFKQRIHYNRLFHPVLGGTNITGLSLEY